MNNYKKITIYGTGRYMYISSPDTQFDKDGIYHTTLEVPKDKAQEAINEINGVISQEVAKEHKKTRPLWHKKTFGLPGQFRGCSVLPFHSLRKLALCTCILLASAAMT